jgi:type II secretory pathway pseudopilin PulG
MNYRDASHALARRASRRAFTLVEALMATAVTAIAGSTLLIGITSSLKTTDDNVRATIAFGMAEQLMDEIAGRRYAGVGADPYQVNLGPTATEQAGSGRERYDDIDDYHGFAAGPPQDPLGVPLGRGQGDGTARNPNFQIYDGYLDAWRREVEVYYVDETDHAVRLTSPQTSNFRAVEVRIYYTDPVAGDVPLANLRRVFSYFPVSP